jgi:adenylate kinase
MILFFGPAGSGKSVQGQLLIERNGWQWLSTGDIFRKSQDPEVLQRLSTGELIDDELTNRVLDTAVQGVEGDTQIVLDGYPRNLDQIKWLMEYLPQHGRHLDCVVLFDVPREELIKRLMSRARPDDTPASISRRLDIYEEKTRPVVDYCSGHGVPVLHVNGEGLIPEIHERIQAAVMACLKAE